MDILCGRCGVEEALYECISCNKNFCIDDWDKVHLDKKHEKLAITILVNEKSREFLVNFFEGLKKEMTIVFNLHKEQALAGNKDSILMLFYSVDINPLWNSIILYLMKVKFVTKKLIYNPIDYFLINSQILAEQYTRFFNLSQFQKYPIYHIQDFLTQNYLIYHSTTFYFREHPVMYSDENLWNVLPDIIRNFLIARKYKETLELLENIKELLIFHKWLKFEINITLSIIQTFITEILAQNYNINLIFLEGSKSKININENFYGALIFYIAFQTIFYNLRNWKYFVKCSKCILRIARTFSLYSTKRYYLCKIYSYISDFYYLEHNLIKEKKYKIKSLHLFERNRKLITFDSDSVTAVLKILNRLIYLYTELGEIEEKNKCTNKFLYFIKNYKPDSGRQLILFLLSYGRFFSYNGDYQSALNYLKRALRESKKSICKNKNLMSEINFELSRVYLKIGDYKNSIIKIYQVKQNSEIQYGDFLRYNLVTNQNLGMIYLHQGWLDESLKYFNLTKESYSKLFENGRTIWMELELIFLEYMIAYIYFLKGEINRPLESFENILFSLSHQKFTDINKTDTIILLNMHIGYLYSKLGNKDKFTYHVEHGLRIFDSYILDPSFKISIVDEVLNLTTYIGNHKKCEEICLKLLEILPDSKYNKEKFLISASLMSAYSAQENYEKSGALLKSIESTLINFNWHDDLTNQICTYFSIGETFRVRKNYYKADIYFQKAKDILEKSRKTQKHQRGLVYARLGRNYIEWGKYKDSECCLFKALDIFLDYKNDMINTLRVLEYLAILYLKKNDMKNLKHYLLEYIKFSKEKNFCAHGHSCYLGLLVNIYKQEKDDANGIVYWNDLREHLKKSTIDFNDLIEFVMCDENDIEIGRVYLKTY